MELIVNLLLLLVIGFVIGSERQSHHKTIGVRSTTLILLGAFTYTYISTMIGGDPSRIIAQIVTGVGFIGAGIIFKDGTSNIGNLTTAILIWALSAVGCLIGLSLHKEAVIISVVIIIILTVYRYFNKK